MDFQTALGVVYWGIDVVNSSRRAAEDMISPRPDVILVGEGGCLDSLAMATFLLAIERRVAELTGQEVSLLDESDVDHKLSEFRTPSALSDLIVKRSRQ